MDCFDFQAVTAAIEATASLRHFRLALCRMTSDRTLSESLVFVMIRAAAFMVLLISSVIPILDLSSLLNLKGIVTGQDAKIFPINSPFANVDNTSGGIE